jgi:hypothetical protein
MANEFRQMTAGCRTRNQGNPLTAVLHRLFLMVLLSGGILFNFATPAAEAPPLPPGHGYLLIRFKLNPTENIDTFALANVASGEVTRVGRSSFLAAGSNAWMALIAMPPGRYYWSEFATIFGSGVESTRNLNQGVRRAAPGSAADTFEIVASVVNYVGDWQMRQLPSQRARLDAIIEFDNATLKRYLADYAEISNKHEIYLSMMGKAAISLDELAKIAAQ